MHRKHSFWQRLNQIPLWIFTALFIVSAATSILALRHNNQTMVGLRDKLYAADKNDGNVEKALDNLRGYVYAHMNTNLSSGGNTIKPPIQLKYTYERLLADKEKAANGGDANLYAAAEVYCQKKDPTSFYGYYRIPCVQAYIKDHGSTLKTVNIPPELYQFDFVSPTWSPDFAGWSLVITILLGLALIVRYLSGRLVKN